MEEMKKSEFDLGNGLRRGARYDSVFFGCYGGTNTFDIRCRFDLKQKLNRARLQKAADDALKNYPEFAVRPVIYNGRICYEENHNPVKLCDDDNTLHHFGSDETNGYLFLFLCGEKHFTFSLFHAQTDASGMISYIITVLWNYAKAAFPPVRLVSPKIFDPYGIRVNDAAFRSMDDQERYDPVTKFAEEGKFVDILEGREYFPLPPEVYDKNDMTCRLVNLEISTSDFFKKSIELHTTTAPLLAALTAEAINDHYDIGDKVITVVTTVNPKPFFRTKTVGNMAYNCPLPLSKADMGMPMESICKKIRGDMLKQLKKSHARASMQAVLKVCDTVDSMGNIDEVSKYLCGPDGMKTQNENTTIFLTYPGTIDSNPVSKVMIDSVTPGMLAMDRAINVYAHGDSLIIQLSMKSDDMTLVNAMRDTLTKHGFDPKVYDMGKVSQNILDFDYIKRVE